MPQIDIRLSSSADDAGFRKIAEAGQSLEAGFKRLERGLDQVLRAFRPEAIVQSFLGGAGIGTAFALIDRLAKAATESNRKLADSIAEVKKAEADLATAREQITRAARTPQQNLNSDQFDLAAVESRIAELEAIERTVKELGFDENGQVVEVDKKVERSAAQNNELAQLKREQARLLTSIATLERQISAEQERQIEASNKLTEQFYAQRDAKKKKEAEERSEKVAERLVKIGEEQAAAEFAKLPPLQQISSLLAEDARLKEESLRLNLDDFAQLERAADIEERRLAIARGLETAYRNAAAQVERQAAAELGSLSRARASIQADPRKTDMEKRREMLPLLKQEQDLIDRRMSALVKEIELASDPVLRAALDDRLERLRSLQSSNAAAQQQLNPPSRLEAGLRDSRDMSDPSKHYQTAGEGALGGVVNYFNQLGTMADQLAAGIENTLGAAVNGITQGIMGWINGTMTFRQALANIGQSVLQTILQTLVQMGVRMVLNAALSRVLATVAASTAIGLAVPTAAALEAIWAGPATLATIASMGSAAAVAPMEIMAAKATVAMSSVAGFADGVANIQGPGTSTSDSILARLSRGESVLTARTTAFLGEDFINQLNADPMRAIARPYQAGASAAAGAGATPQTRPTLMVVVNDQQEAARIQMRHPEYEVNIIDIVRRRRGEIFES
jgi:hypothetical protein